MPSAKIKAVEALLEALEPNQRAAMTEVRDLINAHIAKGFEECVQGGMISWVVPLATYPLGYHCTPGEPLPFAALAAKKTGYSFHFFGLYIEPDLAEALKERWANSGKKLDMGASCIRFKKREDLCDEAIAEALRALSVERFVSAYDAQRPQKKVAAKKANRKAAEKTPAVASKTVKKKAAKKKAASRAPRTP